MADTGTTIKNLQVRDGYTSYRTQTSDGKQQDIRLFDKPDNQVDLEPVYIGGSPSKSSGVTVPTKGKGLLADWANFVTNIENSIFSEGKNKPKEKYNGKIPLSEKILQPLIGVAKIFTTMVKHPVQTGLGIAAFAAVASFAAPLAPLLIAIGFTVGTFGAISALHKAENAKTDEEARKAYQSFGANAFTAITSMFGARSAVKAAKNNGVGTAIDPDKVSNPIRNLVECFRLALGGNTKKGYHNIYQATGHSFQMKMNKFRAKEDQAKTSFMEDLKKKIDGDGTQENLGAALERDLKKGIYERHKAEYNNLALKRDTKRAEVDELIDMLNNRQKYLDNIADDVKNLRGVNNDLFESMGYQISPAAAKDHGNALKQNFKGLSDLHDARKGLDPTKLTERINKASAEFNEISPKVSILEDVLKDSAKAFDDAEDALTKLKDLKKITEDGVGFFDSVGAGFMKLAQFLGFTV